MALETPRSAFPRAFAGRTFGSLCGCRGLGKNCFRQKSACHGGFFTLANPTAHGRWHRPAETRAKIRRVGMVVAAEFLATGITAP